MLEIIISKRSSEAVSNGYPWILKKDITIKNSSLTLAEMGETAYICDYRGKKIAVGYYNPNPHIAARVLSLDPKQKIDTAFFKHKITKAFEKRKKLFGDKYCRLIFGESDDLPGLIIDLYGKYAVAQVNSAGMEKLQVFWLPALIELFELEGVYLDASSKHRGSEGLDSESKVLYGHIPEIIEVRENGLTYFADLFKGQKTGWFYDQRANRKFLAELCNGKSVLDLYTHSGGFGLLASKEGASRVDMVDRSALGLELAENSAKENGLKKCVFIKDDVFDYLDKQDKQASPALKGKFVAGDNIATHTPKKFDIVNADPPAFIKNKKDFYRGLAGYEKLTKQCVKLVDKYGVFAISSCSFFAREDTFQKTVEDAMQKAGKTFELMRKSGADVDHPTHPLLPETSYLKFLAYRVY